MDQRPGQNVDLGLYFHKRSPRFPKNKAKNKKMAEQIQKFKKKYLRVPLRIASPIPDISENEPPRATLAL